MRQPFVPPAFVILMLMSAAAEARTFTVGPSGREYTQLSAVFSGNNLAPGDIVEVDGNASYGSVVVGSDDGGAAGNPVIIRWRRAAGASRPVLQGGIHTIKFQQSNHVVFEGFEVRGGTSTCVFSEAHDVTVRDAVIHACPGHGILGADLNSVKSTTLALAPRGIRSTCSRTRSPIRVRCFACASTTCTAATAAIC
jgi:hypothetical protein